MNQRTRRRPTLKDIAAIAGVSEAAASFALNDKPGVSEVTRARVRAVAEELQWMPSYAAKVLSGARSHTVGFVVSRTAQSFGTESFFLRLMTGIQDVLSSPRYALLLQVIGSIDEEIDTYRRWQSENRVDGVVLVDLHLDDPRPAALAELGLPAVIAGGPDPGHAIPSVSVDDAAAMRIVMTHLADRGFTSVAYISGTPNLRHIRTRIRAFESLVEELGFTFGRTVATNFTSAAGAAATEAELTGPDRPDALIFDNEVLALSGLGVLSRLGIRVPADVGIVTWENTEVCVAVNPSLTALQRDPFSFGRHVALRLLEVIDGRTITDVAEQVPTLIARESTHRTRKTRTRAPRPHAEQPPV